MNAIETLELVKELKKMAEEANEESAIVDGGINKICLKERVITLNRVCLMLLERINEEN